MMAKLHYHDEVNQDGNRIIILRRIGDDDDLETAEYDAWKSPYTSPKPHQAGSSLRVKLGGRWVDVSKSKAFSRAIRQATKGMGDKGVMP